MRRTHPDEPGWTRRRHGRGFAYLDEHGERLPAAEVERIKGLAIPPAWREVWISPDPRGHLQAVGTDDAGRRQYLYHPEWRRRRDEEKFDRVLEVGRALPRARRRVAADLGTRGMSLERACAVAVRLLDLGCFRIGNDVYLDKHGSFGLTTLRREHVRRRGDTLHFAFTGKSGVDHHIEIDAPDIVAAVETMRRRRADQPELLAFRDGRRWRLLTPEQVNEYVREVTGVEATAKDFRTWHGTVLAAAALAASDEPGETKASRKRAVSAAMREVADFLGNTPAQARGSYVDPRVVRAYEEGRTIERAVRRRVDDPDERQAVLERATLRLLG